MLSACTGLQSSFSEADFGGAVPLDRQILLTVAQPNASALGMTGAPETRYLRRQAYDRPTRQVARLLDQLADEHHIVRKEGWSIRSLGVYCEVYVVPNDVSIAHVVERLRADPRVDLAQPMNVFEGLADYDDPLLDLQRAAVLLDLPGAHRLATGKDVVVAVIDSAVDGAHPDLAGRIHIERDFVDPRGKGSRAEVHGTAVAGIIASIANNHEGIVGVAPDVRIASLRACWAHPQRAGSAQCSSLTLARALEAAIALEPGVINLSVTGPPDPLLARLLDRAAEENLIVVAAAPVDSAPESFPASHPAVIVAQASSQPPHTIVPSLLPAPADEILTTTPGAGYAFFSGTSLAAAHLSGILALMLERAPSTDRGHAAGILAETLVHVDDHITVSACFALQRMAEMRVCGAAAEQHSAAVQRSESLNP